MGKQKQSHLTREQSIRLAERILAKQDNIFLLKGNGSLVEQDLDRQGERIIQNFIPEYREDKVKYQQVLWRGKAGSLEDKDSKFRYKTHLSKYLYYVINGALNKLRVDLREEDTLLSRIRNSGKYQEYLERPLIEIERQVITRDQITVSSSSTSHVNLHRKEFLTYQELLELHEKVRQLANSNTKAVIKRPYKNIQYIKDNKEEYERDIKIYHDTFDELYKLWTLKMEEDGLHEGLLDDDFTGKILTPLDHRITALFHLNKPLGKIQSIVHDLKKSLYNLETEDESVSKIFIYL